MAKRVDLSTYNNSWFKKGASLFKRALWHLANFFILKSHIVPLSFTKVAILRMFGAKIGSNVTIKPGVNVKYPWILKVGNNLSLIHISEPTRTLYI